MAESGLTSDETRMRSDSDRRTQARSSARLRVSLSARFVTSRDRASFCCRRVSVCLLMESVDRLSSSNAALMSVSLTACTSARSCRSARRSTWPPSSNAVYLDDNGEPGSGLWGVNERCGAYNANSSTVSRLSLSK